jgi:hypothetical protein
MTKENYQDALKIEHDLIARYLTEVCKHYKNVNQVSPDELYAFIELITSEPHLGFSLEELRRHIDKYHTINPETTTTEQMANELYQDISYFFEKIQTYTFTEEE